MLISVIIGITLYEKLPSVVEVQWNLNLEATTTTEKSKSIIYIIPLVQLFSGIIMLLCNIVIRKSKLGLTRSSDIDVRNIIEKKLLMSKLIFSTLVFVEVMFVVIQLILFKQDLKFFTLIPILLVALLITVIFFVRRIPKITYPKFEYGWKNKYIYYNKDDASIFVEKYSGIGYTLNFANKIAVTIFILFIIIVISLVATIINLLV